MRLSRMDIKSEIDFRKRSQENKSKQILEFEMEWKILVIDPGFFLPSEKSLLPSFKGHFAQQRF